MKPTNDTFTTYVAGFLFSPDRRMVVLVRKDRPAWQAGFLNGVGGKVEPGESIGRAMAREFFEETGVLIAISDWAEFSTLTGPDFKIHFFRAFDEKWSNCRTMESEVIGAWPLSFLLNERRVPNLDVLIPLALNDDGMNVVEFYRPAGDEARKSA